MNRNKLPLFFLILSIGGFSQVGINTDTPTAMLDIVSKNNKSTTKAMAISEPNSHEIATISDNGNIFFKNQLLLNNTSGNSDFIVTSKGENISAEWVTIPLGSNVFNKIISTVYNTNQVTSIPSNSYYASGYQKLLFSNVNIDIPEIILWNGTTKNYVVQKAGLYYISAGLNITTQVDSSTRKGSMWIYASSTRIGFEAIQDLKDNKSLSVSGVLTSYLNIGDIIYINAESNSNWKINNGFINISYSKI